MSDKGIPDEILERFYRTVRPPGFWGPMARRLSAEERAAHRGELRLDLLAAAAGIAFCASMVVGFSAAFTARWGLVGGAAIALVASGALFAWLTLRAGHVRRSLVPDG